MYRSEKVHLEGDAALAWGLGLREAILQGGPFFGGSSYSLSIVEPSIASWRTWIFIVKLFSFQTHSVRIQRAWEVSIWPLLANVYSCHEDASCLLVINNQTQKNLLVIEYYHVWFMMTICWCEHGIEESNPMTNRSMTRDAILWYSHCMPVRSLQARRLLG